MRMGMRDQEVGERLRRDGHGRYGLPLPGEEGSSLAHEVSGGSVGHAAEFPEEGAVEEK